MKHCIRAVMVAVLVFCSFGIAPWAAIAQGNVTGTVYTSPTFDYQLQWSAPWFFVEEVSESGFDSLILADGLSQASFLGTFSPGATLQDFLDAILSEGIPGTSNLQPMLDAQGVPLRGTNGDQEWAVYTGTATLDDGSTFDFVDYYNMRSLGGGVMLVMTGTTVSYYWDDTLVQSWHDLANSILVPLRGSSPTPVPTEQPTVPAPIPTETTTSEQRPGPDVSPTAVPDVSPTVVLDESPAAVPPPSGEGEPAPAFAAGPWRVSVRAVDLGETIDYLSLGVVDGNQWIVVYADVTNWSETDAQLDAATWTLVTADGAIAPDAVSTQSAASLLGLEPANGSTVQVPAGSSIRVALVYAIPASESGLILGIDGNQLPLEDAVGRQFDVTDRSTIATPPAGQSGTLSTLPGDGTGTPQFLVDFGNGPVPVQLAGVEFPAEIGCVTIGDESGPVTLDGIEGPVWLETDPAVTDADTYYVWLDGGAEGRVLLNQFLIASGLALEGDLPEAARFGAWLEQTEEVARSSGIWETCA